MKSYALYVQGLIGAILADCADRFPQLRSEFELDKQRLSLLAEARGLPFFTIDLPEAGKHFDKCLSVRSFSPSRIAGQRQYKKGSPIPRLFKGLYLRVFSELGVLLSNPDVEAIRALRQLYYFAKKLKVSCDDKRTWKSISEFFEVERAVRAPTLQWDCDELGATRGSDLTLEEAHPNRTTDLGDLFDHQEQAFSTRRKERLALIQDTCDIVSAVLGVFDPHEWRAKHGPGVVADQLRELSKYDFPCWPAKLERTFPMADFAFANYALWAEYVAGETEMDERFRSNEPPSRMIAVPKTAKGPRLIAAEPVAHQWCQQIIKDFLAQRLVLSGLLSETVHFNDQSYNQRAARTASLLDNAMTIDLSNASDRMSCWVVERVFRRNESLLTALHASRTRWISQSIDGKQPMFHKLRKFSTAGSATTFPVQSIVFACIAIGTLLYERGYNASITHIREAAEEVLVFGDDIIVPSDVGESVQEALTDLGFKVNHNKTFGSGNFRESCGMDAYGGHDVTPVYANTLPNRTRPESMISSVQTHNNFLVKGYDKVAARIESAVRAAASFMKIPYVPIGSDSFGFGSYGYGLTVSRCKTRYNHHLHRMEVLVHVPSARVRKRPDRYGSMLLQYFTEAPSPTEKWSAGVASKPRLNLKARWEALSNYC